MTNARQIPPPSLDSQLLFHQGRVIAGKYRLERKIAQGGMGQIYLATQLLLGRRVAVKLLPPRLNQAVLRERFLMEASICAQLAHRHIVTIFDYGETAEGALFMVMELLKGQTLSGLLARQGPRFRCSAPARSCARSVGP